MIGSMLRKTAMVIAVPAVIAATSTSPAMASSTSHYYDDDDNDSVTIRVCKEVKDDDHSHYYKKYDHDKTKFTIHVKTDEDYGKVKVRDGKCKSVTLDYDRPRFKVWEDEEDGYDFKYIKCSDGAYKKNKNTCKFDKDEDHVTVTVYNEKNDSGDDDDEDDD
jgi:hypothetical protein